MANQTPTLIAGSTSTITLTEIAGARNSGTLDTGSGAILFADLDTADTHTVSAAFSSASLSTGSLTPTQQSAILAASTLNLALVDSTNKPNNQGSVTWTYRATDRTFDFLADGQTLTLTYIVSINDRNGGILQQPVTITIVGTNDAAVISGTKTGTVTEASGVLNGTPGTPVASGQLTSTDVDGPANTFTEASGTTAFGSFTMAANGVWSYAVANGNAQVQALNAGQTLIDTFTVFAADGTSQVISVRINGANDAATVTGQSTGEVTEAGGVANGTLNTPSVSGKLVASDVDSATTFQAVNTATSSAAGYGTFTMTSAGVWTYTLRNTNAAVQALNDGQSLADTFTVRTADGTTQVISVIINGANDAAVVGGTRAGTVTEASGVGNAIAGTPVVSGQLTASDVDNAANTFQAGSGTTLYGSFAVGPNGLWTYTLDNTNGTVQGLNAGSTLTDSFVVRTQDGTSQVIAIRINGANDAAVIGGDRQGNVVEAGGVANAVLGTPQASGQLTVADPDSAAGFTSSSGNATYGSFAFTSAGLWTYTLNNANATVQALSATQSLADSFTVRSADGTTQVISVIISGTNDAAVVGGTRTGSVTEAGGVANGVAGTPVVSGQLTASDVDSPANTFTPGGTTTLYGSFSVTAGGLWTYTLDNANGAVQALNTGATLTDSFTVTTGDGTSQVITVRINGANDAAVIDGDKTGNVVEAGGVANAALGTPQASGQLTVSDPDSAAGFTASSGNATYGSFVFTSTGVWTYTLNNANASVQALSPAQSLTDSFTVRSADGTTQVISVVIAGANDAATVAGIRTGTVTEASGVANAIAGTPTVSGQLTATDVDNPANTFTASSGTSAFGTYAMAANGVWSYTLDNANAAVEKLNTNATLTDTFTVTTVDGTSQVITIRINGANDAAVFGGALTAAITESDAAQTISGQLSVTDIDNTVNPNSLVGARSNVPGSGGYGRFTVTADGLWTYAMQGAHDEFVAGQTYVDSVTVTAGDGTTRVISVTLTGTNDAAVITGTDTGATVEAGGVANALGVTPTAGGTLFAADVDNTPNAFTAVTSPTASLGGLGTFTITAGGVWSYALDNGNAQVQALNAGETLTDTFTVASIDGTSKTVTVTVTGTNDTATITGTATGDVTEAGGAVAGSPTATGTLKAADVDNTPDTFAAVTSPTKTVAGYGSYTITADGTWTYTLDDDNAAVQALNTGDSLQDTFTVASADGTTRTVTVTINGSTDAITIGGVVDGDVTEAGGLANATAGIPSATGALTATNAVNPATAFASVAAGTASLGGHGTYQVSAAGVWTYLLDNDDLTVEALPDGATLTDTFVVYSQDGSASQTVTVTITGANDTAVIDGTAIGGVTEDATATATGTLSVSDTDAGQKSFQSIATEDLKGQYGTFTFNAGTGVWTYAADNALASVQELGAGASLTDTLVVKSLDGSASQTITVTINGTNDGAQISGDVEGSVTEDATATATGTLSVTDTDAGQTSFQSIATENLKGQYGTFTFNAGT
ncbi:S-layer family protein, partial [uncultured Alsobacter sp.]|uniref:beta strand repeat-containing protein n=1 Tax=uncultured Alsobacter sp. TaxID=1748258 RepID=UPI0025D7F2EF